MRRRRDSTLTHSTISRTQWNSLIETLGIKSYVMYLQDYGGPVGFRLALAHPERVKAMIIQNAVASEDGLGPAWDERKAYWKDRAAYEDKVIPNFLSYKTTKLRHLGTSPNADRNDPDTWTDEFAHLSQPGQSKIQADLFYDYRTNVAAYPVWQAWMRQHEPPMIVVWANTIRHSRLGARRRTSEICLKRRSISWTPGISHSMKRSMRSRRSFVPFLREQYK